jgi:hypothetical protein
MKHGTYQLALERFPQKIKDVTPPTLFEAPWRDLGLLSPDVSLFIYSIKRSFDVAKNTAKADHLLAMQPPIPGLLSPFVADVDASQKKIWEEQANEFLSDQIDFYELSVKAALDTLIRHLEAEAEEYAIQLGLDERTRWLRAQAKARRDAQKQSGKGGDAGSSQ